MIPRCLILLAGLAPAWALAQNHDPTGNSRFGNGYEEPATWAEGETEFPAYPGPENLVEFYVSAVTPNRFFIDASTLSVGADDVVRYALVVRTSGGAENTSFEGIHCKEGKWRLYATGRKENKESKWARAHLGEWRPIENKSVNRHHAALSRDLFCPNGTTLLNADEGRKALRLGKHPQAD